MKALLWGSRVFGLGLWLGGRGVPDPQVAKNDESHHRETNQGRRKSIARTPKVPKKKNKSGSGGTAS